MCNVLSPAFGVVQLYRTFSNHFLAELTRCVEVFHKRSGWCFETQQRRASKVLLPLYRGSKVSCVTRSRWFKHIEPPRTSSNLLEPQHSRDSKVLSQEWEWFNCTEPSLATALQGKQGVQGAYALGSSASNLLKPSRTTALQR